MSAVLEPGIPAFRSLRDADIDEIMQIEVHAYSHPWTAGIFSDCIRVGYYCQILEIDGVIEAYGAMSFGAGECHILNLTVRPESQRQGYGHMMLDHFLDSARRMHAEIALLEVRPSNKAAIGLYVSMGFNEVGVRRNYYPDDGGREDALILGLNL